MTMRVQVVDQERDPAMVFGVDMDVSREDLIGLDEESFCGRHLVPAISMLKNKLVEG